MSNVALWSLVPVPGAGTVLAYCKAFKEKLKSYKVLVFLCDEHVEEEEFLF